MASVHAVIVLVVDLSFTFPLGFVVAADIPLAVYSRAGNGIIIIDAFDASFTLVGADVVILAADVAALDADFF